MGGHVIHATLDPEGAHTVRTRLIALAVSVVAVGGLSGCGSELGPDVHPGRAAVVDGETVTFEQVDDLADEYCALQRPGLAEREVSWPMSYLRTVALDSYVTHLLLHAYADTRGLDSEAAEKIAEQRAEATVERERAERGIEAGDEVVALLARYEYGAMVLDSVGRAELGPQAAPEAALAAGLELLNDFREGVEVSIDPRFGALDTRTAAYTPPPGLMSVSAGDGLDAAQNPDEFDQAYVTSLPRSQRCG
jgi:hypothetical protein